MEFLFSHRIAMLSERCAHTQEGGRNSHMHNSTIDLEGIGMQFLARVFEESLFQRIESKQIIF